MLKLLLVIQVNHIRWYIKAALQYAACESNMISAESSKNRRFTNELH